MKNTLVAAFALFWALLLYLKVYRGQVYTHDGVFICTVGSLVFAAFALFFLIQGFRSKPTLLLTTEGFELATGLDARRYVWAECYDFHVAQPFIRFRRRGYGEGAILNQFTGTSVEICEALTCWQAKYGPSAA